jgi:hypothetical protein
MKMSSQEVISSVFAKTEPLRALADNEVNELTIPQTFPGGTRIFAPRMQGTFWGKPQRMVISLLKTDVFDRRFVARKPLTVDEIVAGAFSEANANFDDMPHRGLVRNVYGVLVPEGGRRDYEVWSQMYPFPCIKPVGQVIIQADDLKGGTSLQGEQSLRDGTARVHTGHKNGTSLDLDYLVGMKRNIVAVKIKYSNLIQNLSFRLYRHQDQSHRKYMDEKGHFIPEKERLVVYRPANPDQPLEYYNLEADADINGPFEAPRCGTDGRFFWVSQKFPAEPTFPEGFEYVMMGLVSQPVSIRVNSNQKGLGANPHIPVDSAGQIIVEEKMKRYSYMHSIMQKSYGFFKKAPGAAVTAMLPEAGSDQVELYVAVVTSNETSDIFAEAKKKLLEAEKLGYHSLAQENKDWYDALYDKREAGRILVSAADAEKSVVNRIIVEDAFRSWAIQDGGYCDPDPRKYEGCEVYAGLILTVRTGTASPAITKFSANR